MNDTTRTDAADDPPVQKTAAEQSQAYRRANPRPHVRRDADAQEDRQPTPPTEAKPPAGPVRASAKQDWTPAFRAHVDDFLEQKQQRQNQPVIYIPAQGRPEDYADYYPLGSPERNSRRTPDEKRQDDADLRLLQRLRQVAPHLAPLLVQPLEPHMGEVAVRVLAEEFAAAHEHDHARMRGRRRS